MGTNQNILDNIDEFQNDLIASNENLKNFVEPPCKSHVTLPVLQLDRKTEEVEKCVKLLSENLKIEVPDRGNKVKFQGVGKFGSRVIFAKPVTGALFLQSIFSLTKNILVQGGIKAEDKREYNPHLTLFKVRKERRKKSDKSNNKIEVEDISKFDDFVFGEETISEILLLSMNKEKADDGFYFQEAAFSI